MVGKHLVKTWSKTIPVLCLSSGEAELMYIVRGSTEALGLQALYKDIGLEVGLHMRSDATAAIGIVSPLGLGRVRHLVASDLWVQEKARSGSIRFSKVDGKQTLPTPSPKPWTRLQRRGIFTRWVSFGYPVALPLLQGRRQ